MAAGNKQKELEARLAAASAGPWEWDEKSPHILNAPYKTDDGSRMDPTSMIIRMSGAAKRRMKPADADLIGHAWADLHWAAGELRRLQGRLRVLSVAIDNQAKDFYGEKLAAEHGQKPKRKPKG